VESITQLMWASDLDPRLAALPLRQRLLALARAVMDDPTVDVDFDMVVNKAPHSNAATPWHQDEAYWPALEDKRALTLWISLDHATLNSGCLFYGARTHLEAVPRPHARDDMGGPLCCEGKEAECTFLELPPGSAGAHAARTLHGSRGNKTGDQRRAYVSWEGWGLGWRVGLGGGEGVGSARARAPPHSPTQHTHTLTFTPPPPHLHCRSSIFGATRRFPNCARWVSTTGGGGMAA